MSIDRVKKIGAITVGQTPRDDIVPEIQATLGDEYELLEAGALDGLSAPEVEGRRGPFGGATIVTRLRDGSEARVSKRFIVRRLRGCVGALQDRVDLMLFLCTGDFELECPRCPVLYPGRILRNVARSLEVRRLGVLTPAAEQRKSQLRRWRGVAREVIVAHASPYGPLKEFEQAARELRCGRPDLVVMDCIGYGRPMTRLVRDILNRPVLSAPSVLARLAVEILE